MGSGDRSLPPNGQAPVSTYSTKDPWLIEFVRLSSPRSEPGVKVICLTTDLLFGLAVPLRVLCMTAGLGLAPGFGLLNIPIQGELLCFDFLLHLNPNEFSSSDKPSGCS